VAAFVCGYASVPVDLDTCNVVGCGRALSTEICPDIPDKLTLVLAVCQVVRGLLVIGMDVLVMAKVCGLLRHSQI
jgi:hypothetical protein